MDKLLGLLNFFPGLKTKIAAVAAFALAVIAAWNTAVPELGYGPCTFTPEELAAGAECGLNLTFRIPEIVNVIVLALLGVGAANQPKNAK